MNSDEFEAYLDYHKQSQEFDPTEAEPSQLLNIQTVNNPSVSEREAEDPEDAEQLGNLINKIVTFNEKQEFSIRD